MLGSGLMILRGDTDKFNTLEAHFVDLLFKIPRVIQLGSQARLV
jgi:hypothetical protein